MMKRWFTYGRKHLFGPGGAAGVACIVTLALCAAAEAGEGGQASGMPVGGPWIHPFWILALLLSVIFWFYMTAWVADDSIGIGLNHHLWTALFLGLGWAGALAAIFFHPVFCVFHLFSIGGAGMVYINLRNAHVPLQRQIFKAVLGTSEAKDERQGGTPEVPAGASSATRLVNEQGADLRSYVAGRPDLKEAAGLLGGLVDRVCRSRVSSMRIMPGQSSWTVDVEKDGVRSEIDAVKPETGGKMAAAVIRFCNMSGKGRPAGKLKVFFADGEEAELAVRGVKTGAGVGLVFSMPDWRMDGAVRDLSELGMEEAMTAKLSESLAASGSCIILSGPAKSGLTSTFYGAISLIDIFMNDVVTFEKRPAGDLDQVRQLEVDVESAEAFGQVLPSVLRQEPQVLGVDGLSNADVAARLIEFAADGGVSVGTVKAPGAAEAVSELRKMVSAGPLCESLKVVTNQRLARRLCLECREAVEPAAALLSRLKIDPADAGHWFRPAGCDRCLGTGYDGLTGIFEMLIVTGDVRKLLVKHDPTPQQIKKAAGPKACRTLHASALKKVQEGLTTLSEVKRVLN